MLIRSQLIILLVLVVSTTVGQNTVNVHVRSTAKSGGTGTAAEPFTSLDKAMEVVEQKSLQTTNTEYVLQLAPGVYFRETPLMIKLLGGTGNFLTISGGGAANTFVQGGRPRKLLWKKVNGGLWRASVSNIAPFRALWVGGKAYRMASDSFERGAVWTTSQKGFLIQKVLFGHQWRHADAELVQRTKWVMHILKIHPPVTSTAGMIALNFQQPFFDSFEPYLPHSMKLAPTERFDIQNTLSVLNEPGEFFYDREANALYVKPFPGTLVSDEVIIPVCEQLFIVQGVASNPIAKFTLKNLGFRYNTWRSPDTIGYRAVQNTIYARLEHHQGGQINGALEFNYLHHSKIENCSFSYLNTSALRAQESIRWCTFRNNLFEHIGAAAIDIGRNTHDFDDQPGEHHPSQIVVENNKVYHAAEAYNSAAAISLYFPSESAVLHNHVAYTAYSGISMGWGYTYPTNTMRSNRVNHNLVEQAMVKMTDGGGIYMLGPQPKSECMNNVILGISGAPKASALLYHDETGMGYQSRGHVLLVDRADLLALNLHNTEGVEVSDVASNTHNHYYFRGEVKPPRNHSRVRNWRLLSAIAADEAFVAKAVTSTGHRAKTNWRPWLQLATSAQTGVTIEPISVGTIPVEWEAEAFHRLKQGPQAAYTWGIEGYGLEKPFSGWGLMTSLEREDRLSAPAGQSLICYKLRASVDGSYALTLKAGGNRGSANNGFKIWQDSQLLPQQKWIVGFPDGALDWRGSSTGDLRLTAGLHELCLEPMSDLVLLDALRCISTSSNQSFMKKVKPPLKKGLMIRRRY